MTTTSEIISDFAFEQGDEDPDGAIEICHTLLSLDAGDLFLAYDALGCFPDRTPKQDDLYSSLKELFFATCREHKVSQ